MLPPVPAPAVKVPTVFIPQSPICNILALPLALILTLPFATGMLTLLVPLAMNGGGVKSCQINVEPVVASVLKY